MEYALKILTLVESVTTGQKHSDVRQMVGDFCIAHAVQQTFAMESDDIAWNAWKHS